MSNGTGVAGWFSRPVLGVIVIAVLMVVLAVPIGLILGLIEDRVEARNQALKEVTTAWGGQQSILGPRLVIPFQRPRTPDNAAPGIEYLNVLPATLAIEGRINAQTLKRGLFTVPVYTAQLRLRGRFDGVDPGASGIEASALLRERAALVLEIADPRAVGIGSTASWDGQPVELLPGATEGSGGRPGIHARVTHGADGAAEFDVTLELRGSEAIWLAPFGRATRAALTSDWPHPSFAGAWLPDQREVTSSGFSAEWEIPFVGRDYAQVWLSSEAPHEQMLASRFGAELISPVDHYRMAERSTKYAVLFLLLTFGLFWLFDTLAGIRIHPIQYLLVGAAICLFFLLELSLSEHIGFVRSYTAAALAVVGLVAVYARAVLGSVRRGAGMAAAVAALYGYLYVLLTLEHYALLVGSLGLFAALAAVMLLTRRIDWHDFTQGGKPAAP